MALGRAWVTTASITTACSFSVSVAAGRCRAVLGPRRGGPDVRLLAKDLESTACPGVHRPARRAPDPRSPGGAAPPGTAAPPRERSGRAGPPPPSAPPGPARARPGTGPGPYPG